VVRGWGGNKNGNVAPVHVPVLAPFLGVGAPHPATDCGFPAAPRGIEGLSSARVLARQQGSAPSLCPPPVSPTAAPADPQSEALEALRAEVAALRGVVEALVEKLDGGASTAGAVSVEEAAKMAGIGRSSMYALI